MKTVCMLQTQSQNYRQQMESGDPKTVPIGMAAKDRGRPKHGRTGCHRGNNGKKSLTRGGVGVPGADTDALALTSSHDIPGKESVPSQEKPWSLPYSMGDLKKKQLEDPDIGPILKWLESGQDQLDWELQLLVQQYGIIGSFESH